jgi:SAM-dependent methyltransferase
MAKNAESDNVSYYDNLAAEYRLFFQDYEQNMEAEGRWLDDTLHRLGARRILDASAGTGRQAIPLRERGYDVVAADPSGRMLQEARVEAASHGVALPTVRAGFQDLTSFARGEFDAVIALGNGLTHGGTRDAVVSALRALHACCRPGGTVIVGIKDFETLLKERPRVHPHGVIDTAEGRRVLVEIWTYVDPVLHCSAILLNEGEDRVSWHGSAATTHEYMLTISELEALAREAGYVSIERLDHPGEVVFALHVSAPASM